MTAARHAATARRAAPPHPDPSPDQRFRRDPALPFAESRRACHSRACNPARGGDWSDRMLHLDAGWLRAVRRAYLGEANDTTEPVRIVRDAALHARFSALNALLFSAAAAGDKEAALIEFVGERDRRPAVHAAPSS